MSRNGLVASIRRYGVVEERLRSTPSPFEQLSLQMDDILGDGGILKGVVQPGEGPPISQNASVLMHYSGFLEYSDRPFETSTHLQHPRMMKLGKDVTLVGLEMGLLTMRKGEFARFLFQPKYAYGDIGCPPTIPAAAMILYEVQIVDFLDSGQVDEFLALSQEEQNAVPLPRLLEVVNTVQTFGNRCFNQRRYYIAKDRYKEAVTLLVSRESQTDAEKEKINAALLPLYLNLCVTQLRLECPHKALKYGNKVLEIDSANTKALYRCGKAYLELGDYESAQGCLISAQAKKPFDSDINNLLRKVTICYKEKLDEQKDMCTKMCRDFRGESK
ncbi:inactive peptidyl-prolyl cis-trans isomerase FKBP6 [Limanda limanda]|uniref:inactive peptidyl-prolyl cis-trans isomerase FKBP6 n=1 Tax=Limanda limanda TaxID=27771 RepID=UPI0029C82BA5|nr:inactive peptidyl-prolyl cis-trans isomerase FKBP6 [Limanda limanda]